MLMTLKNTVDKFINIKYNIDNVIINKNINILIINISIVKY